MTPLELFFEENGKKENGEWIIELSTGARNIHIILSINKQDPKQIDYLFKYKKFVYRDILFGTEEKKKYMLRNFFVIQNRLKHKNIDYVCNLGKELCSE